LRSKDRILGQARQPVQNQGRMEVAGYRVRGQGSSLEISAPCILHSATVSLYRGVFGLSPSIGRSSSKKS
jgi:hypothetical protein